MDVAGATNATYSYIVETKDTVSCIMTADTTCLIHPTDTSNLLTVIIHSPLLATVSIVPATESLCPGTMVTFTAIPHNEGTSPYYKWQVNGLDIAGATNATFNHTADKSYTITCIMTSSMGCVISPDTSNVAAVTV